MKNEKKEAPENSRANRVLYVTLAAVLCITAVVIGVTSALNRTKDPATDLDTTVTTTAPVTTAPTTNDEPVIKEDPDTVPSMIAPVAGNITKEHDPSVLVYSNTMGDWRTHCGVDITATEGAPVVAVANGTVEAVWTDPMMGYCVSVAHNGGAVSVYANLQEGVPSGIAVGASVKQGDTLGYVGCSAALECADDAHLHFELEVDEVSVDPLSYMSSADKEAAFGADTSYEG